MKLIDVLDTLSDTEYLYVGFDDSKRGDWFLDCEEIKYSLPTLHDYYNRRVIKLEPINSGYYEEAELIIILEGGLLED